MHDPGAGAELGGGGSVSRPVGDEFIVSKRDAVHARRDGVPEPPRMRRSVHLQSRTTDPVSRPRAKRILLERWNEEGAKRPDSILG